MDLSSLQNALSNDNDSPLYNFDELICSLNLTTKKETIKIIGGNYEVHEVVKGIKLTKSVRKPINKQIDMIQWINETKVRYERYMYFVDESMKDFSEICSNIKFINKMFEEKTLSFKNIVKVVYKTDKKIIKVLKKFELIE